MQRLFSITEKIKFEAMDKHHIRMIHPNITNLAIAQGISISHKAIINRTGKHSGSKPAHKFTLMTASLDKQYYISKLADRRYVNW